MNLQIKLILAFLFFSSCEYESKIKLGKKLPLTITLEDSAIIKEIDISEKKEGSQYYHSIINLQLTYNTNTVVLDSLIKQNDSLKINEIFIPNKDYSLYIKTDKGSGAIYFHLDSIQNVIVGAKTINSEKH